MEQAGEKITEAQEAYIYKMRERLGPQKYGAVLEAQGLSGQEISALSKLTAAKLLRALILAKRRRAGARRAGKS